MEIDRKLSGEVMVFVAENTGYPLEKIGPETMLAYDIGMFGDDAWEFFEAFAKRFSIDPESFRSSDFVKQFGNEGIPIWPPPWEGMLALLLFFLPFGWTILSWWVKKNSREEHEQHKDDPDAVRVKDLVQAAAAKHWMKTEQGAQSANPLQN